MQTHEDAIAYLDMLIATKKLHTAEREAKRQRASRYRRWRPSA